jgi:hypothetical protein
MPLFQQDNCQDCGLCPESSLGLDSFSLLSLAPFTINQRPWLALKVRSAR